MSDMRSLWCIRENTTHSWCKSSKFSYFGSFDEACIFSSEANALKAIKSMKQNNDLYQRIHVNGKYFIFDATDLLDYKALKESDIGIIIGDGPLYEAVECTLST